MSTEQVQPTILFEDLHTSKEPQILENWRTKWMISLSG